MAEADVDPSATGALEAAIAAAPIEVLEVLAVRRFSRSALRRRRANRGQAVDSRGEVLRRVFRPRGFEHRVISHVDLEPPNLP